MVVLEGGGMLTNSGNQYLQPDYLSPLPTTVSIISNENTTRNRNKITHILILFFNYYSWMRRKVH